MKRTLLSAIAASLLSISAHAEAIHGTELASGLWTGGGYANNGTFSHCAVSATYRSGIVMGIWVDRAYGWSLAFVNDAWNLPLGKAYSLSFRIDGGRWRPATANTVLSSMIRIPMADEAEVVNLFRRGVLMEVMAGSEVLKFRLDGTSRVVPQLVACVQQQLAVEQMLANRRAMSANPFGQSPASSASDVAASRKLEATRVASQYLIAAGDPGVELIDLEGVDAAWRGKDGYGIVTVVMPGTSNSQENAATQAISNDSRLCKGQFSSGLRPYQFELGRMVEAFTACEAVGDDAFVARYFVIDRSTGGYYVFSSVALGQTAASQKAANPLIKEAAFKAALQR